MNEWGEISWENPFLYHPDYIIKPKQSNFIRDPITHGKLMELVFEIESRHPSYQNRWDTAEVLLYISRIVAVFKSLKECARVVVNYDTAKNTEFSGLGTLRKHVTIQIVYVLDSEGNARYRKSLLDSLNDEGINFTSRVIKKGIIINKK